MHRWKINHEQQVKSFAVIRALNFFFFFKDPHELYHVLLATLWEEMVSVESWRGVMLELFQQVTCPSFSDVLEVGMCPAVLYKRLVHML